MSLNIKEDNNQILGRKYNVEYKSNNDSIHTFSNVLANVDGTYFWFSSLEEGLDIVRQDRIMTMICLERNKSIDKVPCNDEVNSFDRALYCEVCGQKTNRNNGSYTGDDGVFVCDNCQDPE